MSVFFLFKQKTAYEMRISDWSSDVCSSDLDVLAHRVVTDPVAVRVVRGLLHLFLGGGDVTRAVRRRERVVVRQQEVRQRVRDGVVRHLAEQRPDRKSVV